MKDKLIKICSHPCAGKTTYINKIKHLINPDIYKLHDQDRVKQQWKKNQLLLIEKNRTVLFFGSEKTGDLGTSLSKDVIYIVVVPPYDEIVRNAKKRKDNNEQPKWKELSDIIPARERLIYWAGLNNFKLYPSFDILFNSDKNGKVIFNSGLTAI